MLISKTMETSEKDIEDDDSEGLTDEEYAEMGWSAEQVAEERAERKRQREATEREMTKAYGPPKVRERKNKRYVAALVREYSEPFIRRLLVELNKLDTKREPNSYMRPLNGINLKKTPLHEIIRPYEFFAYNLDIEKQPDGILKARGGRAYGHCGSGSTVEVKRWGKGFRVVERSFWCA